jgi:hypothetical protein
MNFIFNCNRPPCPPKGGLIPALIEYFRAYEFIDPKWTILSGLKITN